MKKIIILLIACIMGVSFGRADEKVVPTKTLPKAAMSYVQKHFPKVNISLVQQDTDIMDKDYSVYLEGGIQLEFTSKGEFKSVENKNNQALPASIMPYASMTEHIKSLFPQNIVVKLEKDVDILSTSYKVELDNDMELEFDQKGNFKRLDD